MPFFLAICRNPFSIGTSSFLIYLSVTVNIHSPHALEAYNDGHGRWQDISEKELHDKLMHNSRYPHLPYYAKHIGLKAAQTA